MILAGRWFDVDLFTLAIVATCALATWAALVAAVILGGLL